MRADPSDVMDELCANVEFTDPVSPDDCAALRDALRFALKEIAPNASIEVYCHKNEHVVVQVDRYRKYVAVQKP
jgi:hypothetical protein